MGIMLEGRNLYIVNKKPKQAKQVEFECHTMRLRGDGDVVIEEIDLKKHARAVLFCRQLKTIIFILSRETISRTSLIMAEHEKFEAIIGEMKRFVDVVEQNVKINSYADSLVEKMQAGISVTILETKEEIHLYCPTCGMQCDPNIPYCMECGTPI